MTSSIHPISSTTDPETTPVAPSPAFVRTRGGNVLLVGSPDDKLAAALDDLGIVGQSPAQRDADRRAQEATARALVDAAPQWGTCTGIAVQALTVEGPGVRMQIDEARRTLLPDVFLPRLTDLETAWKLRLVGQTLQVDKQLVSVQVDFAPPALAAPTTSVEASTLGANVAVYQNAGPREALALVEDAERRSDRPLIERMRLITATNVQSKNSWRERENAPIVALVVSTLDRLTWTPERAAADYARERAEKTAKAWRSLATELAASPQVDPVRRKLGQFAPLLPTEAAP